MARIPLDPPRTVVHRLAEWYSRHTYGAVLDPGAALGHNPRVLLTDARHELSLARVEVVDVNGPPPSSRGPAPPRTWRSPWWSRTDGSNRCSS